MYVYVHVHILNFKCEYGGRAYIYIYMYDTMVSLRCVQVVERPSKHDGFCFKFFHPLKHNIHADRVGLEYREDVEIGLRYRRQRRVQITVLSHIYLHMSLVFKKTARECLLDVQWLGSEGASFSSDPRYSPVWP